MPPVGGELGEYTLAGQRVLLRDGQCVNEQGALAGSALDMVTAVRNGVELLGLPLEDSARMASTWPAEFLGLAGRRGRIIAGQAADLVVIDDDWRVRETWIAGQRETH